MRDIRLRDGSVWRLETIEDLGNGARLKRREHLTYVWVACSNGEVEFRLMFAATWELWSDRFLVEALEREIARVTAGALALPR
jgi:hypothetical protein